MEECKFATGLSAGLQQEHLDVRRRRLTVPLLAD